MCGHGRCILVRGRVRADPEGWDPKPKRRGGVEGITPGVCQTVGRKWHMEGTEPAVPSRPFEVLLDDSLPFRRQGMRKWLSANRYK